MAQPTAALIPGDQLGQPFADSVLGSQIVFRAVLAALSEPGTVQTLTEPLVPPAGLLPTTARLLIALADFETPVWLTPALPTQTADWIRFHTSAAIVEDPALARFAVLDGAAGSPSLAAFDPGDERYPDKSATLIVQVPAFVRGPTVTLSGPGIERSRVVAPGGLHAGFWAEAAANHARYPLGVDLLLVAGDGLIGLPRSTAIASPLEVR